jgi:hypothetical protein
MIDNHTSNKTVSIYEPSTSCSCLAITVHICILNSEDMKDKSSHKETDSIKGLGLGLVKKSYNMPSHQILQEGYAINMQILTFLLKQRNITMCLCQKQHLYQNISPVEITDLLFTCTFTICDSSGQTIMHHTYQEAYSVSYSSIVLAWESKMWMSS